MLADAPAIRYYSSSDLRLAARVWDRSDAVADVIYLHGIISHGGWYLSSCAHLASEGFQVHFLERRGSGLNVAEPGDVDRWQTWMDDVGAYLDQLPTDRPRILLGISWGGILATAFVRHHPDRIQGLGLICPGLFSLKAANAVQRTLLRAATGLGVRRRRVTVPLEDPALFTNSPRHRKYVAEDPLCLRKITVRFATENLKLLEQAVEAPDAIRVPLLLMLAGEDPIADNAATRHFAEQTAHANKRILEYAGASHTLEFEDDPQPYFHDLAYWCREVATSS